MSEQNVSSMTSYHVISGRIDGERVDSRILEEQIQAAVDQMAEFLREDGTIVQTCQGSCDPGSGYVPWSPVPPP